VIIVLSK
jgi:hypothetical protein